MTKSIPFKMYIHNPTDIGSALFKIIASPLTPPAAMLLGIKNITSPKEVRITPNVAKTYSLTSNFLFTSDHFTLLSIDTSGFQAQAVLRIQADASSQPQGAQSERHLL